MVLRAILLAALSAMVAECWLPVHQHWSAPRGRGCATTAVQMSLDRRSALATFPAAAAAAAAACSPSAVHALPVPGFLKEDLPRPMDIGVMGTRKEGANGFLNKCPISERTCVSSYQEPADTRYIPPLT